MAKYTVTSFPRQAEARAEEVSQELGLGVFERLDPWLLARFLEIGVTGLSTLHRMVKAEDRVAISTGVPELAAAGTAFCAVTVFCGPTRHIVHNDYLSAGRQAADICHELSHGLLLHPPAPALVDGGIRNFDSAIENEAALLGAELLIPRKAVWGSHTRRMRVHEIADTYGTSVELARWRVNTVGFRHRNRAHAVAA